MKKRKVFVVSAIAAAFVVAAIILFFVLSKKQNEYRLLKIFEVEGKANVSRKEIGDIDPYANMVLQSGDRISLDSGKMTIQADEDKYIYLEENTEIVLNASGNSENSKTNIEIVKGAITNDIQNKLNNNSSYEINTPNSTMSVRGTVFYVYLYEIDGVKYTRVCVVDGTVTTRLVYKDGTVADKEVSVAKGMEVTIYEDATTTDYLSDPKPIDYDTLPDSALLLFKQINDEGKELSITNPEIKHILEGPYDVTFIYDGEVFGTQTVNKGEKAEVPSLSPAETGNWKFDFNTPIERDTEIEWK